MPADQQHGRRRGDPAAAGGAPRPVARLARARGCGAEAGRRRRPGGQPPARKPAGIGRRARAPGSALITVSKRGGISGCRSRSSRRRAEPLIGGPIEHVDHRPTAARRGEWPLAGDDPRRARLPGRKCRRGSRRRRKTLRREPSSAQAACSRSCRPGWARPPGVSSSKTGSRARLKSSSIGMPSAVTSTFDGLMSRCRTPRSWAWSRASASRAPHQAIALRYVRFARASRPVERGRRRRLCRLEPVERAARTSPSRGRLHLAVGQDPRQGDAPEIGHAQQMQARRRVDPVGIAPARCGCAEAGPASAARASRGA